MPVAGTAGRSRGYTLGEIVHRLGGEVVGNATLRVSRLAPLATAGKGDLAVLAQGRLLPELAATGAAAVILGPEMRDATSLPRIVAPNPYAYFARVLALFHPEPAPRAGADRTALVHASARVAKSASIGPRAVVGRGAVIGARAAIGPGCIVGEEARIGAGSRLFANVVIYPRTQLGERVAIHAGAVIGSDGFGNAMDGGRWVKIPQVGRVVVGDDVEIGANTTIDRGTLGDTVIGDGVRLDNLIQIGHNVTIGAHTAIAACVGIAGSTRIGSHCLIGGAAMISGHLTIGDRVTVSGGTSVIKSLAGPGAYTSVYPVEEHQAWLKNAVQIRRLAKLAERVQELESRLAELERRQS